MQYLTSREKEVLELIIQGNSNPKIAQMLNITVHTVKAHLQSIFNKLNVKNRVQAAVLASKTSG